MLRRLVVAIGSAAMLGSVLVSSVAAGGPPQLSFYIDDVRYRTVGTPTDFTHTGAPAFTYDKIYSLGNGLANVADAKPGDRDFNGGRWAVYAVTWNVTPWQMTNDGQVLAAAQAGDISISPNPVKLFFCNVAKVPPSRN